MNAGAAAFLAVRGLRRSYNSTVVLEDVSFDLARGSVLALFGPNGAGKTTLLRTLAGALKPEVGTIHLDGHDRSELGANWFRKVGVVSHASYLYGRLTVRENLTFYGRLFGLRDVAARVSTQLDAAGLADRAEQPARELSRGLTQRLAIARALLHDPELVLLDEPFAGLDTAAADVLTRELESLRGGQRTVLLVTHDLARGAALADHHAVLAHGRYLPMRTHPGGGADGGPVWFERQYHELLESVR